MVNTMVRDPKRRKLNRKLDRQKKARRKQSEKLLSDPEDFVAHSAIYLHEKKVAMLKQEKEATFGQPNSPLAEENRFRVLRRLDGISYWVIEDPDEIRELVCTHVRKEWESDIAEQEDHGGGSWLGSLQRRNWRLSVVELSKIKLSERIMNYSNKETGYSFRVRLNEREKILERDIDKFGAVIRPLIIREEDNQLMDGYCRYHVLLDRNISKTYAYIGSLP